MKQLRWSNEDGREAGSRNFGRLALFSVPLSLGLAAAVWLGVWIDAHYFRKAVSQEQRAAIAVGASVRPSSPIKIVFDDRNCLRTTKADLSGRDLTIYVKNECASRVDWLRVRWQLLAVDDTIIRSGKFDWCNAPTRRGDTAECMVGDGYSNFYKVSDDDRGASMRVGVEAFHDP